MSRQEWGVSSVIIDVVRERCEFADISSEATCGVDVIEEWAHGLLRGEENRKGASRPTQRGQVDGTMERIGGAVEEKVRDRLLSLAAGGTGGCEDFADAFEVPVEGDVSRTQLEEKVSMAAR